MAKLKLPFELEKPSSNEYVTQASEIGYKESDVRQALNTLDGIVNGTPYEEVIERSYTGETSNNSYRVRIPIDTSLIEQGRSAEITLTFDENFLTPDEGTLQYFTTIQARCNSGASVQFTISNTQTQIGTLPFTFQITGSETWATDDAVDMIVIGLSKLQNTNPGSVDMVIKTTKEVTPSASHESRIESLESGIENVGEELETQSETIEGLDATINGGTHQEKITRNYSAVVSNQVNNNIEIDNTLITYGSSDVVKITLTFDENFQQSDNGINWLSRVSLRSETTVASEKILLSSTYTIISSSAIEFTIDSNTSWLSEGAINYLLLQFSKTQTAHPATVSVKIEKITQVTEAGLSGRITNLEDNALKTTDIVNSYGNNTDKAISQAKATEIHAGMVNVTNEVEGYDAQTPIVVEDNYELSGSTSSYVMLQNLNAELIKKGDTVKVECTFNGVYATDNSFISDIIFRNTNGGTNTNLVTVTDTLFKPVSGQKYTFEITANWQEDMPINQIRISANKLVSSTPTCDLNIIVTSVVTEHIPSLDEKIAAMGVKTDNPLNGYNLFNYRDSANKDGFAIGSSGIVAASGIGVSHPIHCSPGVYYVTRTITLGNSTYWMKCDANGTQISVHSVNRTYTNGGWAFIIEITSECYIRVNYEVSIKELSNVLKDRFIAKPIPFKPYILDSEILTNEYREPYFLVPSKLRLIKDETFSFYFNNMVYYYDVLKKNGNYSVDVQVVNTSNGSEVSKTEANGFMFFENQMNFTPQTNGEYIFTFYVIDTYTLRVVSQRSVNVVVGEPDVSAKDIKCLLIGDSYCDSYGVTDAIYTKLADNFNSVTFLGTRTNTNPNAKDEAYGSESYRFFYDNTDATSSGKSTPLVSDGVFNLPAYMSTNYPSVSSLDFFLIMLGTNEISSIWDSYNNLTNVKTYIDKFIDSVHTFDSSTKILIETLPTMNEDATVLWRKRSTRMTPAMWNRGVEMLNDFLIRNYSGREDEKIYVMATNAHWDRRFSLLTKDAEPCKFDNTYKEKVQWDIHPSSIGVSYLSETVANTIISLA